MRARDAAAARRRGRRARVGEGSSGRRARGDRPRRRGRVLRRGRGRRGVDSERGGGVSPAAVAASVQPPAARHALAEADAGHGAAAAGEGRADEVGAQAHRRRPSRRPPGEPGGSARRRPSATARASAASRSRAAKRCASCSSPAGDGCTSCGCRPTSPATTASPTSPTWPTPAGCRSPTSPSPSSRREPAARRRRASSPSPPRYPRRTSTTSSAAGVGAAPFLVAVDGVTDPGNLGAILRSCDGAGVDGVLIPRHRAVHVTPTVAKAAAGAIEHVPIALVGGLPATLTRLRDAGIWVVGLDDAADRSLFDLGDLADGGDLPGARRRGGGTVPARPRALRRRRQHPDARTHQLAQRVGRGGPGDLRGRPPPHVTLS